MKKISFLLLSFALAACSGQQQNTQEPTQEEAAQMAEILADMPDESQAPDVNTLAGQPYKDVVVEFEGKTSKLSDFVGGENKLTLVDFWASWCRPCRDEIPNLKAIWEKYHDKGVMVVGIASWDKPEDTKQAIEELGIKYPQIINAQTIGTDAYGIVGIPQIILIDHNGKILAVDLRGSEIEKAIQANL